VARDSQARAQVAGIATPRWMGRGSCMECFGSLSPMRTKAAARLTRMSRLRVRAPYIVILISISTAPFLPLKLNRTEFIH
jgi:hypothetical protein